LKIENEDRTIQSEVLADYEKWLRAHDAEIRRKVIEEFIDRFNKSTIIMGRASGRTFMLQCLNEIAEQMKGES
jgi:hypothetical protein